MTLATVLRDACLSGRTPAPGGRGRRRDIRRVWRVAERLEYGVDDIDEVIILTEIVLFGCMKENIKARDWVKQYRTGSRPGCRYVQD